MIITCLDGGLGNAMWEAIVGYSVAKKYGHDFCCYIDEPTYSQRYKDYKYFVNIWRNAKLIAKLPDNKIFFQEQTNKENYTDFSPIEKYTKDDNIVLQGYFQNFRYISDEIIEDFLTDKENFGFKNLISGFMTDIQNTVNISIRRGDYVRIGIAFPLSWYEKCYHKYFEGMKVIVNSDDVEYVRNNIDLGENVEVSYVDSEDPVELMYSLAKCPNHIIYNGTYGWWIAKLSEIEYGKESKIVCPENYAPSCDNWIKENV